MYIHVAPWKLKIRKRSDDRELCQARSKPDTVDRPVRTARTFVYHYNSTQYCNIEFFLNIPFLQTNITSQMWPSGGKGEQWLWTTGSEHQTLSYNSWQHQRWDDGLVGWQHLWSDAKAEQESILIFAHILHLKSEYFHGGLGRPLMQQKKQQCQHANSAQ